jgi:hypothetical protein
MPFTVSGLQEVQQHISKLKLRLICDMCVCVCVESTARKSTNKGNSIIYDRRNRIKKEKIKQRKVQNLFTSPNLLGRLIEGVDMYPGRWSKFCFENIMEKENLEEETLVSRTILKCICGK